MNMRLPSLSAISKVVTALVIIGTICILAAVVKGKIGNPIWYQTTEQSDTVPGGPFESSNNNSRYALVQSLAESGSVNLSEQQARFGAPDIVELNGKFLTSFMPGISMVAVPFYVLGKSYGLQQLFAFLSTMVFALINAALIYYLARKLTHSHAASLLGSITFLIATNALVYATSLTQHHGSTAVLLAAVAVTTLNSKILRNILLGLLAGIGLLFDVPNVFMIAPIGLAVLFEHFQTGIANNKKFFSIDFRLIFLAVGLVPALAVFFWYNIAAANSPIVIAQMFPRSDYFDNAETKQQHIIEGQHVDPNAEKYALSTRQQLRSFTILMISNERSWLYYSPILLLGIAGIYFLLKLPEPQKKLGMLIVSVLAVDILVYSMFGDPWGGWSFGPRYLIPGAAMMAILLAIVLKKWQKNIPFLVIFIILAAYSVTISLAGALTLATIPPKIEAEQLTTGIPYTYQLNFNQLQSNKSSSLAFNLWFNQRISAQQYWYILSSVGTILFLAGIAVLWKEEKHDN